MASRLRAPALGPERESAARQIGGSARNLKKKLAKTSETRESSEKLGNHLQAVASRLRAPALGPEWESATRQIGGSARNLMEKLAKTVRNKGIR